jgi:hypothetical protein
VSNSLPFQVVKNGKSLPESNEVNISPQNLLNNQHVLAPSVSLQRNKNISLRLERSVMKKKMLQKMKKAVVPTMKINHHTTTNPPRTILILP